MSWRELQAGAPELAREGWARFSRTKVALLGTIREDGSPRISPVEPFLLSGHLVVGVMPSPKLDDLRRDSRCVLHSSVSDIDGSEGEFKLHGRAVVSQDPALLNADGTWWAWREPDRTPVAQHRSRCVGARADDARLGDDAAAASLGKHEERDCCFRVARLVEREEVLARAHFRRVATDQAPEPADGSCGDLRAGSLAQRNDVRCELIEHPRRGARPKDRASREQAR